MTDRDTHHILHHDGVTEVHGNKEYAAKRQAVANIVDDFLQKMRAISAEAAATQVILNEQFRIDPEDK